MALEAHHFRPKAPYLFEMEAFMALNIPPLTASGVVCVHVLHMFTVDIPEMDVEACTLDEHCVALCHMFPVYRGVSSCVQHVGLSISLDRPLRFHVTTDQN